MADFTTITRQLRKERDEARAEVKRLTKELERKSAALTDAINASNRAYVKLAVATGVYK